ncbi:hypothetical protein IFM89_002731 [Coptis chinensis]|uniref:glutathione transferase n=1 Tax=Coptis chinensis TaxID=261450 RepID=A0A835M422_9MAGN|nr:hypothetical protein IFM89_002731 [Coptis chinensis]
MSTISVSDLVEVCVKAPITYSDKLGDYVITKLLEEKYPGPSLEVPPEKASVGSKIFSTFIGFLKSKDLSDGTEQTLLTELTMFNDYIK